MTTEAEVKKWVREEQEAMESEKKASCDHHISGTYQPDNHDLLLCDQCGNVVTMADHNQNGEQRVAHPRVPLR